MRKENEMDRAEGIEEIRNIMKATGLGVLTPVDYLWEEIKAVIVDVSEDEYLDEGLSE